MCTFVIIYVSCTHTYKCTQSIPESDSKGGKEDDEEEGVEVNEKETEDDKEDEVPETESATVVERSERGGTVRDRRWLQRRIRQRGLCNYVNISLAK